jgi:hypothetical protein
MDNTIDDNIDHRSWTIDDVDNYNTYIYIHISRLLLITIIIVNNNW